MAVLSKIRNRSGLLIGIIAFALFAFVIGDLIQSGSFGQSARNVGTVNGNDISFEEFRAKVANVEKNGQGTSAMQASNQVWNQEVNVVLLNDEFEKLGLRIGEKHIIEYFKGNQNIGQNPMFQNALGKFDYKKFKDYFTSIPDGAKIFSDQQKDATINSKYQIYNSLIKGALFTTNLEGKFKYEMESNKVSFDFVAVPFSSIKDSDVKISDDEIIAYMKTKEKKFKSEESRELEYVMVEDKPSTADENEIKNRVNAFLSSSVKYNNVTKTNDTIPSFKNASNPVEFVNANSDKPYDSTYLSKEQLPAQHVEALFNLPVGEIYGPYMNDKFYCISRGMGRKSGAKVKASHILISWEGTNVPNKKEKRTKEQAKVKADDLLKQAQANPGSFMILAMMNSDDSSAQNGGDLGFFGPNQMVKPFNDFCFNNPIGKIGLVETEYGYHIINVTDKQDAVRLATIAQKIEASEATNNKIYEQATKFEMDAQSGDFAALAKKMKLTVNPAVRVKAVDESVGTIQNQRQIVKWAFDDDTSVGNVKRFEIVNVGHVIVKMKKVNEKGLMAVEDARPQVEYLLKNKKKAEKIMAKMKGGTLATIAASNKVTVQNAVDLTIENPTVPNAGFEPKVVGYAFSSKAGVVSKPIEGNSGVYVIVNKTVTKAPAIKDYKIYVDKLKPQVAGNSGRVLQSLKNQADIEDNRALFY
jgi:peptidyl-prolyl cis-trans isomerase D